MMKRRSGRQSGYSLAEALVVMALIGMVSVVSIPAFVNFMRTNRVRTSLRTVTASIRYARQLAVTKREYVLVTYDPSITGFNQHGSMTIWEGRPDPANQNDWTKATWAQKGPAKTVEAGCYFANDAATPITDLWDGTTWGATDSKPDLLFLLDGTISNPGTFYIKSKYDVPVNTYKIDLTSAASIATTAQKS